MKKLILGMLVVLSSITFSCSNDEGSKVVKNTLSPVEFMNKYNQPNSVSGISQSNMGIFNRGNQEIEFSDHTDWYGFAWFVEEVLYYNDGSITKRELILKSYRVVNNNNQPINYEAYMKVEKEESNTNWRIIESHILPL